MTIGRIERGQNVPKLQNLQALTRSLGLELVDLLTEPATGGAERVLNWPRARVRDAADLIQPLLQVAEINARVAVSIIGLHLNNPRSSATPNRIISGLSIFNVEPNLRSHCSLASGFLLTRTTRNAASSP